MDLISLSRRNFLTGTGAWLGASALGLAADEEKFRTVSIFHTTDLHGHIVPTSDYSGRQDLGGFARCATCIRGWRKESPHSLLLDVGDVYQGTAESLSNGGKLMIGLFNTLDYDAWTLGNHDFDWGPAALEENLALSKPPVLTGNISRGGKMSGSFDGAWKSVTPWMMKEVGGFRVAVIGLVTPGLPYWLSPETLGGASPTNPAEALKNAIAEAKAAKADAIIVTGHMGWRNSDDFANPVRGILREARGADIYLAGHTHQNQPSWEMEGVLCSQASYHGIHCGRVDLTFDLATRKLVDKKAITVLMDSRYDLDPAVMDAARPDLKKAEEQLARKVASVTNPINGQGRGNRLASLFCEFFAEALKRNGTPVDGVFHGTFNTGDLAPGELTVADCWRLLPYENLLVTAELSAGDLIEIVREDRGERQSDRVLWPFDLTFDAGGKAERFLFKGEPVAADRRFTIGFNSYDAQSGGQRLMRLREIVAASGAKRTTTSIDTRGALINGLLDRKQIS